MEIYNKRIFITGGLGFIGSWLCSNLLNNNKITIYDDNRRNALKFTSFKLHKNLTYIRGDVLDKDRLKKSLRGKFDIIFHLAAIAGVSSYYRIPLRTMEVNLIGTHNLLEIVKHKDIEVFMDFSTSEVYGRQARYVKEEDSTCQGALSDMRWTYAISKLAAEKLSHCYRLEHNLPVVSVRPFNIYGPRQVGEGAIQIFISKALKNETVTINGNGSQVRAWCYIDDFIEGVLSCVTRRRACIGQVFNLGNSASAITIFKLAKKIIGISGSKSKISFKDSPRTDIEYRVPDISKAGKLLHFSPKIDLNEGLKRTIEWYQKNRI